MREMIASSPRSRARVILALLFIALLTLTVAPLILVAISLVPGLRWSTLSEIGQSFNGVSALLSAVALVGVVESVRTQSRQLEVTRAASVRTLQLELLKLQISDPDLMEASTISDLSPNPRFLKQQLLVTMWFRYMQFAFLAGAWNHQQVRTILAEEYFVNRSYRIWWGRTRSLWLSNAMSKADRDFIDLVDQACAVRGGPVDVSREEKSRPAPAHSPLRHRRLRLRQPGGHRPPRRV